MATITSGYAIATWVMFSLSNFFVVIPVSIPIHHGLPRIPINLITAPILAIAILWAARCLGTAVIRDGIAGTDGVRPYNIIILFFSIAYMAITLDITGIFRAAAFWVSKKGDDNGWRLYLYFYIMFTLLSILVGSDLVSLSGTGFLVHYAEIMLLDPRAWVMAEFAAANTASMVLFVGNPTNVVITEGFGVNNAVFTAYTVLPFLACNIFCFAVLVFQFRKNVPRKLIRTPHMDPPHALADPVGAWVGSFMLSAMLVLCLVVSFFGIDVWMISLPFAFAKFLFDLGWDYYRYSHRISNLTVKQDLEATSSRSSVNPSSRSNIPHVEELSSPTATTGPESIPLPAADTESPQVTEESYWRSSETVLHAWLCERFPTPVTALPRLPFVLIPFIFCQYILVGALRHQGSIDALAEIFVHASRSQIHPTIWLIGFFGVLLCNSAGTNIGATILLTQVVNAAGLPYDANRSAAIALAVASNIGAVSTTFASLNGPLWYASLSQKGIQMTRDDFAFWNILPLLVMTTVGLGVVSAEMAVLFR